MHRLDPGSLFRAPLAAWLLALLAACGGGSGAGGDDSAPGPNDDAPPPAAASGTVGLLFTDAPSDEFARINVTITGATLLGGSGQVTLFSGVATLNLLDLKNFTEVFVVADAVPPGDYSKIRLEVAAMELVREDEDGNVVEVIEPRLPGNGKLDLNPRAPFAVEPGATVLIEVDWDVDKSIHIVETGNGGWLFRPVMFVDIIAAATSPEKLSRVEGTIVEADPAAGTYVVCPARNEPDEDDAGGDDEEFDDCVSVQVFEDTGIFDRNGDPSDPLALVVGEEVTAIGELRHGDDDLEGEGGDEVDFQLAAVVVEIGPPGTFEALAGTVLSPPGDGGQFGFELAPGQGFATGSDVSVQLQDGTRLFDRNGDPLEAAAIVVDLRAEVEGVVQLSNELPDLLKAALVVLDTGTDEALERLAGAILSVDGETGTLMLATDDGDRCVTTGADTDTFLITVTADGATSGMVELDVLEPGMAADAYGVFDSAGCFAAQTLIAFAP